MAPSTKGVRPWSCEIASFEHRDVHSNVMGLVNGGANVILGDRRNLALVDFSDSSSSEGNVVKTYPRNSKWDITKIAPHIDLVATSSNNSLELFSTELKLLSRMSKAHQRLITDVNWRSTSDLNVFASTSLDPDVHLWDARSMKSPQMTLNGLIGASQCKWNRVNPSILATVHEGDVKLWDIRKKDAPFTYFTAHVSARILSFDWSYNHEQEFVTTGHQDQLIKFHSTQKSENKSSFLKMAVPVWIARHTPFGEGLATIIIPHLHQNDNSLFLWNINSLESPIHSFFGHRDVIYDFDWRKYGPNNLELVTWSRDRTLRLWQVDKTIQCQCGSEASDDFIEPSSGSESHEKITVDLLKEEFEAIQFNFSNIRLEEINFKKRLLKLCVKECAILVINFPSKYPNGASPPTFVFLRNFGNVKNALVSALRQKIINALKIVAFNLVRNYQPCLEPCLSHLDSILTREFSEEEIDRTMDSFPAVDNRSLHIRKKEPVYFEGDGNVPYPRTSGAVFCGNGALVVFGSKLFSHSGITPRALSAYGAQLKDLLRMDKFENSVVSPVKSTEENVKKASSDLPVNKGRFNVKTVKSSSPGRDKVVGLQTGSGSNTLKRRKKLNNQTKVSIYNVSMLFPFSKYFASRYLFNPSKEMSLNEICNFNARVARKAHREDLVRLWMMANQMAGLSNELAYWEHHPLGRPLLTSMIQHYIKAKDPQTAATLILAFQNDKSLKNNHGRTTKSRSSNNSVKFYLEEASPRERSEACVHASACSLESTSSSIIYNSNKETTSNSSNKKFWFLKPGALNSLAHSTSPYHTVSAVTNASFIIKNSPVLSGSTFKRDPTVSNLDLALTNHNKCRSNSLCCPGLLTASGIQSKMKKNTSRLRLSNSSFNSDNLLPEEEPETNQDSSSLLDPKLSELYNKVKMTYGELLYNWGLFSKRAEVLKRCNQRDLTEQPDTFQPVIQDNEVEKESAQGFRNMVCALCQLPVKGLASSCLMCGHGGHSQHLMEWFLTPETKCPTGCGCLCQKQSGETLLV